MDENESDMLTKILSMEKLIACRRKTGLVDFPPYRCGGGVCYQSLSLMMGEMGEKPKLAERPNGVGLMRVGRMVKYIYSC